jgi:signal transduction histidine kinase
MGLKLIRASVEQLGGFIEAASEPGRGSTFRVYLPACQ